MTEKLPIILDTKIVAQSRLFTIEAMHLRFSNGEERHYERLKGRTVGSVLVVPMLDESTLLLIREYGAGIGQYTLGFPKGAVEVGEDIVATANRELMEEVGYAAHSLVELKKVCLSPGYMESSSYIILARNLYPCHKEGDEPEAIEVVPWKLTELDELLQCPEFFEARSIAALLLMAKTLGIHI